MQITEMAVAGAFRIVPTILTDPRGSFHEAWRLSALTEAIGRPFVARQVNYSVSSRNTLRGIHVTTVPPGQAKLVTCVRGALLDAVVDLRVGSPTFGVVDTTVQEAGSGVEVYVADGLGHAFLALTDDTAMSYVCDTEYAPGSSIDVQALDPELAIPWHLTDTPLRSDKDRDAPTLAEVTARGLLPAYGSPRLDPDVALPG